MAINSFPATGGSGDIPEKLIDPVSKFRVSQPENLIDTDFEYGLQPTKWETVEIINNTPAFFSKGGDTTIPDIDTINTNAGTREITVTTLFPHNLAAGIPIRVEGTKSITADGSYIINATPSITSFTYLCKQTQDGTESIYDLYTSIITGEFFQGSQISISDSEGIITDASGPASVLTIKTKNKHGFGLNTPFYFLNLNSTISQEFESQNDSFIAFDPTNSSIAQTFDGSNSLQSFPIDFSNSASTFLQNNQIVTVSIATNTVTIDTSANNLDWSNIKTGQPIYYSFTSGPEYFTANPRGVVFAVSPTNDGSQRTTFGISLVPGGLPFEITSSISGFFKIANKASLFSGNNFDSENQVPVNVEVEENIQFDGANENPETIIVSNYSGTTVTADADPSFDYYNGSMIRYTTSGTAATGLTNNATYFVSNLSGAGTSSYSFRVSALPGGASISISGGTGTQTFAKIGVSADRDIIHVKNGLWQYGDLLEYTYPEDGHFAGDSANYYYVQEAYDAHNFKLGNDLGSISPLTQSRTGTDAGVAITPTEVTVTGFAQPVTWSVTAGTLPQGLTLNTSTGVVSGTTTTPINTRQVSVTLTDSRGLTATQIHTYQFNQPPSAITPTTITRTDLRVGVAMTATTVATEGFFAPLVWNVQSGTLPSGLTLNTSTGVVSGTPTATYSQANVIIRVTDKNGLQGTQTHTYKVDPSPSGQAQFTNPGTFIWQAPVGVTSVSAVCIGGGGGGSSGNGSGGAGGGGGGLRWRNNIPVTPGQSYTVVVGSGGARGASTNAAGSNGGTSYFISTGTVSGGGGPGAPSRTSGASSGGAGTTVAAPNGGGGNGGRSQNSSTSDATGGGGAGGYSGNGGNAGNINSDNAQAGAGGGGGGGGAGGSSDAAGAGGGVGIFGQGANGARGTYNGSNGTSGGGGSGGQAGAADVGTSSRPSNGGLFGGGGGGAENFGEHGSGGGGAVRIIWGIGRAFPSTNTQNL
jgi:hypothetical protein